MGGAGESRLAYAVDLLVQLKRDAECAEPELHRRDRALMPPDSVSLERPRLLTRWLDRLRSAGYPLPGSTVASVFRVQLLVLSLAGLAVGWGVAAALFHYDGESPINVVHVLAVLVGLQLLLLLLLGLASLPRRCSRIIPGLSVIQDILAWLSPGQITRTLARRLPASVQGTFGETVGRWRWDAWSGRILKWAAVVSAQTFGVAFNLGALAAALYLVTFSDLAFSWSTTLVPDYERGRRITTALATPWARWLPEAVPSKDLIQSTLYYRQARVPPVENPAKRGGWWPFLVASIATYGLLPRVLLLGFGWWRFHRTLRGAFTVAGADGVMDRLTTEAISTQAIQAESAGADTSETTPASDAAVPAGRYWVINWSGVEVNPARLRSEFDRRWGCGVIDLLAAGGGSGTASDNSTIKRVSDEPNSDGVIVLVKAWEPPVLDFLDFLSELRKQMGSGRNLMVVLLGLDADGVGAARDVDAEQWRRRLRTMEDEDLGVVTWEGERL